MHIKLRKPLLKAVWAIGVAILITVSVLPNYILPPLNIWDKLEHFAAYLTIAFVGFMASTIESHRKLLIVAMLLLGVGLEVTQYFLPTRHFEMLDLLANILGVATAYIFYRLYKRMKN